MKKSFLAVLLVLSLLLCLAGCGDDDSDDREFEKRGGKTTEETPTPEVTEPVPDNETPTPEPENDKIKIGLICLHDENYLFDQALIAMVRDAMHDARVPARQLEIKTNIGENRACYEAAKDLAQSGCNIIIADSFGHERYMIQAAKEYPDIQFCHLSGFEAHTSGLSNFHNFYANIHEGRYAAGVAAGLKMNEMIDAGKISASEAILGYVGAFTYAEVISGYTAFYLGAKSVCPSAKMKVLFSGSWDDEEKEGELAKELIWSGCVVISQHSESEGVPMACEMAGVPNVAFNRTMVSECPNSSLLSVRINWTPYFTYVIGCVTNGSSIKVDWSEGFAADAVQISDVNERVAAAGTKEKLQSVVEDIKSNRIRVFSTDTFTVQGQTIISYLGDVDFDVNYTQDTEMIGEGYFHESEYRSSPAFDLGIDGIELLNYAF